MRYMRIVFLILCVSGMTLCAQSPKKKTSNPIQAGDITRAMDAFIASDNKEEFSQKFLVPIFHATETVMFRQLPDAAELAAEMAQALYIIWDYPNKELTDTAARTFLTRPDLFKASFESIPEDERSKAVAAIIGSWGELKDSLEKNPQTDATTRVRIRALDNMIQSWKCKYPQYVPKRWL